MLTLFGVFSLLIRFSVLKIPQPHLPGRVVRIDKTEGAVHSQTSFGSYLRVELKVHIVRDRPEDRLFVNNSFIFPVSQKREKQSGFSLPVGRKCHIGGIKDRNILKIHFGIIGFHIFFFTVVCRTRSDHLPCGIRHFTA